MIVCLCRAVSDRRIREAITHGARTLASVQDACGAGTECGTCIDVVKEILLEETGLEEWDSDDKDSPGINKVKEYPRGQSYSSTRNC